MALIKSCLAAGSASAFSDLTGTSVAANAGTQTISDKKGGILIIEFIRSDQAWGVASTPTVSGLTLIDSVMSTAIASPVSGTSYVQTLTYSIDNDAATYSVEYSHGRFVLS